MRKLKPQEIWTRGALTSSGTRLYTSQIIPPQGEGHTPAILREEGNQAALRTVILEILGLILDRFKREPKPMRAMLV